MAKENGHKKHKRARKENRDFVAAIHDCGVGGDGFWITNECEFARMKNRIPMFGNGIEFKG